MSIANPDVGKRVWTIEGLHQHGPLDGPKTDVPPNTGGTIIGTEKPYQTYDHLLYIVKWDTGQETKHYLKELFSIGPFESLKEFRKVVKTGHDAKLLLGPQGGFRAFSMIINHNGEDLNIELSQEQRMIWIWLKEVLEKSNIDVYTEKLPSKPRKPKR